MKYPVVSSCNTGPQTHLQVRRLFTSVKHAANNLPVASETASETSPAHVGSDSTWGFTLRLLPRPLLQILTESCISAPTIDLLLSIQAFLLVCQRNFRDHTYTNAFIPSPYTLWKGPLHKMVLALFFAETCSPRVFPRWQCAKAKRVYLWHAINRTTGMGLATPMGDFVNAIKMCEGSKPLKISRSFPAWWLTTKSAKESAPKSVKKGMVKAEQRARTQAQGKRAAAARMTLDS